MVLETDMAKNTTKAHESTKKKSSARFWIFFFNFTQI